MTDHPDIGISEAEAWKKYASAWEEKAVDAAAEIIRLRAEAEALRKDAERYRWLADDCDGNAQDDFIIWLNGHVCSRQEFDASIDAAIAATKEQQS